MLRHLGYVAESRSALRAEVGTSEAQTAFHHRRIRELIRGNLDELARVLQSNAEHGILFYRVSSQIIPFASHPEKTICWWDEFASELAKIGQFARRYRIRLQMNPGRHALLNSPSPETVALSILELGWHVRLFDAMQLDFSHKLVLQVGATFGDRQSSLNRFVSVVNSLPPEWKIRLVIENNDAHYGLAEVLQAAEQTGLPVVVACSLPATEANEARDQADLIQRSFETWTTRDGPPMIHLGNARRHDWISWQDVEAIFITTPCGVEYDCLVDAKQGDQLLFDLLEKLAIRRLAPLPDRIDLESSRG